MRKKAFQIIGILSAAIVIAAGLFFLIFFSERNAHISDADRQVMMAKEQMALKQLFTQKDQVVIDCLGDSITWGMYSTPQLESAIEQGDIEVGLDDGGQLFEDAGIYVSGAYQSKPSYPEVLEQTLNQNLKEYGFSSKVKTVNDGVCGDWITKNTYQRMSCDPDVVILLMCGNNYYFGYPIEGLLEHNIRTIRKKGAILYLANYPAYPGEAHIDAFIRANEHIAEVAEKEGVPVIDLSSRMEACIYEGDGMTPEGFYRREELFSPDRIHLSEKGYELVGRFTSEAVLQDLMTE